VRPEGLGQFKKSTSSGLEPATFRLGAQCLNHYATACPRTTVTVSNSRNILSSFIHRCLYSPLLGSGRLFRFVLLYTDGRIRERGISPSKGNYLHTGQHKQNKCTQTSMPQMGFEPTITFFEGANTVHALDRAATVIDMRYTTSRIRTSEYHQ
jgi:hypothetical protein